MNDYEVILKIFLFIVAFCGGIGAGFGIMFFLLEFFIEELPKIISRWRS